MGVWGELSAVQSHSMGGVRGESGGTHTHTHTGNTHRNVTRECCTYPLATYPLKSARLKAHTMWHKVQETVSCICLRFPSEKFSRPRKTTPGHWNFGRPAMEPFLLALGRQLAERKSPKFLEFSVLNFAPNLPQFFCCGLLLLCFLGSRATLKIHHQKIPSFFNANLQANPKNNYTEVFLESRQRIFFRQRNIHDFKPSSLAILLFVGTFGPIPPYWPCWPIQTKEFPAASKHYQHLSGTESAILSRESGDAESGNSNRTIPMPPLNVDRLRFGLAILNRFSAILLRFDSILCFSLQKFLRFQACDSGNRAIRDSVPLDAEFWEGNATKQK